MSLNNQQIDKLQFLRNYQPSAIRSSILMAIIQAISFVGSFILMGLSIYVYASAGKTKDQIDKSINYMKHQLHLQSENSIEQAYLLMVIGVLLLLIWKLTTMVRNRNAYILLVNDLLDEEED